MFPTAPPYNPPRVGGGAATGSTTHLDGSSVSVTESAALFATVQSRLRAKPCCCTSRAHLSCFVSGPNCGKQWLRPPEMGLLPSHWTSVDPPDEATATTQRAPPSSRRRHDTAARRKRRRGA